MMTVFFACFSDHDGNSQSASYQTGLPCSEPPVRSAEPECRAGEVPEVIEWLPWCQEKCLPPLLLHLRWWTALNSRQLWPRVCTGAHDQGGGHLTDSLCQGGWGEGRHHVLSYHLFVSLVVTTWCHLTVSFIRWVSPVLPIRLVSPLNFSVVDSLGLMA